MVMLTAWLPGDLVCESLSFLSAEELLVNVAPVCRGLEAACRGMIGMDEDPAQGRRRTGPFYPALHNRYVQLCELRRAYEALKELNQSPTMNSINLFQAIEHICNERVNSKFESLVTMEDPQLLEFTQLSVLEYKQKECSFWMFVRLDSKVNEMVASRETYLLEYFEFVSSETAVRPRTSRRVPGNGQLTQAGIDCCNRIFDFFDFDKDERLGWEELSAINQAAGLPLSRSAFVWVQGNYDIDGDGKLTRQGYQDMFLENFLRVPRLMYKDLLRLQSFMERNMQGSTSEPQDMEGVVSGGSRAVEDARMSDVEERPRSRRRLYSASSTESQFSNMSSEEEDDEDMGI